MRTYTMSVNEFMAGGTDWKKELKNVEKALSKANKKLKKALKGNTIPMNAIVPLALAVAIQPIAPAFASGTELGTPVFAMPDVSQAITDKIMNAFQPLIGLLIGLSHPLCLTGMIIGCLFIIMNSREKGLSFITNSGLGYVLIQFMPFLMDILKEITKAL